MGLRPIEQAIATSPSGREGRAADGRAQGGTFTITNGGIFGSLLSTPIVNPPQSGILGMHTIQNRPVVVGRQDRDAADDVYRADVRPSHRRWPRGRTIPRAREGPHRGSGAAPARDLHPTRSDNERQELRRRRHRRRPGRLSGRVTRRAARSFGRVHRRLEERGGRAPVRRHVLQRRVHSVESAARSSELYHRAHPSSRRTVFTSRASASTSRRCSCASAASSSSSRPASSDVQGRRRDGTKAAASCSPGIASR